MGLRGAERRRAPHPPRAGRGPRVRPGIAGRGWWTASGLPERRLRACWSQPWVGRWVVARGDPLRLSELGGGFKLTDASLESLRVAAGGTCHFKGALVFA